MVADLEIVQVIGELALRVDSKQQLALVAIDLVGV